MLLFSVLYRCSILNGRDHNIGRLFLLANCLLAAACLHALALNDGDLSTRKHPHRTGEIHRRDLVALAAKQSFGDQQVWNTVGSDDTSHQATNDIPQTAIPAVLQVTASGLAGIADAGKNLFDSIVHVLQQSQAAWDAFENAINLTNVVHQQLGAKFGNQTFTFPLQLSINSTMDSSSRSQDVKGSFWVEEVEHNGRATYNPNSTSYQVYRNVKDFGAVGDGVTDDTAAINDAISRGSRCGAGCASSTVSPALVYFPPGTYLVSTPLISYYYTQLVGSAVQRPTLLAAPTFQGIAVIDEDPYLPSGSNWYINQNNFFRSVYNFQINLTQIADGSGTGIHHQVSQATGLFNVHFEMQTGGNSTQQGIYMENGSGGFMSNLSFRGGKYGAYLGNQQFTFRKSSFRNCETAISQAWNWGWSYHDITIEDCNLGLEMQTSPNPENGTQGAASVLAVDWAISRTPVAIHMTNPDSGVLILNNLIIDDVDTVVRTGSVDQYNVLLAGSSGSSVINDWIQGPVLSNKQLVENVQGTGYASVPRPPSLLQGRNISEKWFSRDRPQYQDADISEFVNVRSLGCKGDGQTDDSQALQQILDQYAGSKIIFVPHGTYLLENTVTLPSGTRLVGEVWPVLMGGGPVFQNTSSPQPVVRIGNPGDIGIMEICDMVFSTRGPAPGAIVVEWNIREDEDIQGSAGMWDSHIRVGGFAGTNVEADNCAREKPLLNQCRASFLNIHLTTTSSAYLENVWVWTADHDLDYGERAQTNIQSGRGVLIESQGGPVWMYGGASEHAILYQYNIVNARKVFISIAQTETAYFQGTNRAVASEEEPLSLQRFHDPDFSTSSSASSLSPFKDPDDPYENRGLGIRIANSTDVFIYGAGLYSFFDNYNQDKVSSRRCQKRLLWVDQVCKKANVWVLNLNTVGTEKLLTVDGQDVVDERPLRNGFGNTLAVWNSDTA